MEPTFVGDRWYWGLMKCATHFVKFPDAPVCFIDEPERLQALPKDTRVVLAVPSVRDFGEPDVAPAIAALTARQLPIIGCFGKTSRADEFVTALQAAGCLPDLGLLLDALTAKTITQKSASWPMALYKPRSTRQTEISDLVSRPLPALKNAGEAHWSLLAYFGLPAANAEGPDEAAFIRLAKLIAASEVPDEWAAGCALEGAEMLENIARAFHTETVRDRTIAILNPGTVGPRAVTNFLAVGDTASKVLVSSAAAENATALVISMPVPGSPAQIVVQMDGEIYDLARAIGASTAHGVDRIVVSGELDALLSRLRQFYTTLN